MTMNPNQPKKILLMGHGDGYGGAQTAFRELYTFIRQEGHTVKVISLTDHFKQELPFNDEVLLGRIAHQGPAFNLRVKKTLGATQAGLAGRRFRPDIFVSVGLNNSANVVARLIGNQCFKIGQDFIADRSGVDSIWRASRAILNGVGVQAPSMLEPWQTAESKLTGINWLPCFPEPPVSGILHIKRVAPTKEIKLAYFGRLAGNKGLSLLVRAFAMSGVSDNVTLDLWGQGVEEKPLRKLVAELGLEAHVQFLGRYPSDEAGAKLMISYDALVLCSTEMEGLPLILLEAMAYGLPFMATNVGAIRDCCLNNPDTVFVQPTQDAITQGLHLLIQRIKSDNFDAGRLQQFYEKTFSYKVMAARWRLCFQDPNRFFYESA